MNTIRQRLADIDPTLHLLNDDGAAGITIIIHGADFDYARTVRPDIGDYASSVSWAQVKGRVYLLSWRSGCRAVCGVPIHYPEIEENAHRLGRNLKTIIRRVPKVRSQKLTLIGYSLGAHVITSALLFNEWNDLNLGDVILLGAAICEDDYEDFESRQFWRRCLSQIDGKIFNCYSSYDGALFWRNKIRRLSESGCIGRSKVEFKSSRIRNISLTGTLSSGDHDYLGHFDRVMNRVYPVRKRSADYSIQTNCVCPWCDADQFVDADVESPCFKCGVNFEVRSLDGECCWTYPPKEVACLNCDHALVVQEPGEYHCNNCRSDTPIIVEGSNVYYAYVDCECPHCEGKVEIVPHEEMSCPHCKMEFSYNPTRDRYYFSIAPRVAECPKCHGDTGIPVQQDRRYPCADCGKVTVCDY